MTRDPRMGNLIIPRKVGQTVIIGDKGEITLTVIRIWNGEVRLGIEAPREYPIMRSELLE